MDEFSNRISFTIDDGSGATISATCLAPPRPDVDLATTADTISAVSTTHTADDQMVSPDGPKLRGVDIGVVVKVKGGIREYWGARQVAMKAVSVLGDTAAEVKAWKEGVKFRKEVLRLPWVLTKEEERRCREEAEGEKWRIEEEERRKKRRREMRAGKERGALKEKRTNVEKDRAETKRVEEDSAKSIAQNEREAKAREEREKARRAWAIQRLIRSHPEKAGKYAALGL